MGDEVESFIATDGNDSPEGGMPVMKDNEGELGEDQGINQLKSPDFLGSPDSARYLGNQCIVKTFMNMQYL